MSAPLWMLPTIAINGVVQTAPLKAVDQDAADRRAAVGASDPRDNNDRAARHAEDDAAKDYPGAASWWQRFVAWLKKEFA